MFKRIVASNFQSWESLDFKITPGVTLLDGWNYDDGTSEGSGKSACLNALCWALFGKLPKPLKTDDVIREGQKGCEVTVYLDNDYSVVRSRKPNDLRIMRGKEEIRGKDAKATQTLIEDFLELNFETFCQAIYYAQNYPNKFITATEEDRARIFSGLLDLKPFDQARRATMDRAKAVELDQTVLETNRSNLRDRETEALDEIERLEEMAQEAADKKRKDLDKATAQIQRTLGEIKALENETDQNTLEDLQKDLEGLDQISENVQTAIAEAKAEKAVAAENKRTLRDLKFRAERLNKKLSAAESKVKDAKSPKQKNCPTCGTKLKGDSNEHMAAHIAELEADKSEIEAELSGVEKALKAFKEIDTAQLDEELEVYAETAAKISQDKKEIQSKINKIQNNAVMLQRHHKTLGELKADLKEIESRKPPKVAEYIKDHKAKLKKLEKDIKANKAALENARELAARLKVLKNGWKAVKGYVFQGVLDELTRKANRYLADLFEIPVSIEFSTVLDNKGIPKIKDTVRYGDEERPFHAFSGGQSRRIQLAVDFSLSEVIAARGSKSIPLMILDEAFKDLSSESMEKIVGLLEHRKGPTIIVEHNPVLKNIVAKSFKVELRDGVSSHAT